MAAGCLVARALAALCRQQGSQAEGAGAVRELVRTGAEPILAAVEEGSLRAALDERMALQRAQAQLERSTLDAAGAGLGAAGMPGAA